jgi:hypothetical protein
MDFMNRNGQSQQQGRAATTPGVQAPQQQHMPSAPQHHDNGNGGNFKKGFSWSRVPGWLRVANVVLLFSITILALSLVLLFRSSNPNEAKYIVDNKYQAVFLNNGQVYFGKVTAMNSKYFSLQNVFYLNSTTNSSDKATTTTDTSSNNFTLVKLGCELHGPYDQMVINREQVTFWENLKDDGQVVKTINEWVKQNPSGQKCSTTTNTSSQSSSDSSSTQNAATSSSTGTSSNAATGTTGTTTTNKNQ